ncbi:MAG: ATP-binding protein [bacterium]|nr:ATP-binding protein [bacterium]
METLTIAGKEPRLNQLRDGAGPDRADRRFVDDRPVLRAMLNTAQHGIIYADTKGVVRELNTQAAELLDREKFEVIGASLVHVVPPEVSASFREILHDFRLLPFKNDHSLEVNLGERSLQLNFTALRERDGSYQGVIVSLSDRSEVRQLQQCRRSLEANLMQAYKLASIGILASGIAHNLNGPLSVIVGYLDMLNSRMTDSPEISLILAQAERMKEIIATVMLKSRNAQEIRRRPLDLNEVISNELKFFEANLVFKHKIQKTCNLAEKLPEIEGVYSDFSQCFSNIINNAIDAMHLAPEKKLFVSTRSDEQNVYIEFKDTGVGLDPEESEKLFIPFYSTKAPFGESDSGKPTGTGLGLFSARQLLAKYGGKILVDGKPGQGAHFTVVIPIAGAPAETTAEPPPAEINLEEINLDGISLDEWGFEELKEELPIEA